MSVDASRIISGTWGQVWEDGREVAEVTAMQAKLLKTYETVQQCGSMMEDRKLTGVKITGSMTINKVFTRNEDDAVAAMKGHDIRRTLVSKLADPDAFGAERVVLYGVSYDDVTLADWTAGRPGTLTIPFQATGLEYVDRIEVRG